MGTVTVNSAGMEGRVAGVTSGTLKPAPELDPLTTSMARQWTTSDAPIDGRVFTEQGLDVVFSLNGTDGAAHGRRSLVAKVTSLPRY